MEEKISKPKKKKTASKKNPIDIIIKSVVYTLAVLGVLFILIFSALATFLKQGTGVKPLPEKIVLTIDFSNIYGEVKENDLLMDFAGVSSTSFYDIVNALNVAADDERVVALVADVSNVNLGLSQVENLRRVIKNFSSKGKKTTAFSTGFGTFGNGTKAYYLASAFDEIALQPGSELGITGISIEIPFFKDLLSKIGIEPEFYTRYEYKNAIAPLINDKFSKEHKEEIETKVATIFNSIVADISKDRELFAETVVEKINNAPFTTKEAQTEMFIDSIYYRQSLYDDIYKDTKGTMVSIEDYTSYAGKTKSDGKYEIAFLVLDGVIDGGNSYIHPFKDNTIGSKTVLKQLEEILQNKNIKAVVLRINSPGGSYEASNEIWAAIERLKEKRNIPVVVSMSDYAASGGYFIALAGDYIFAEKSTLTGSIGVFGGKFILEGLWNKLGISWDGIKYGQNSGASSMNRKFSESEHRAFNKSLDNVYEDFTNKVAQARKIDVEKIDTIARGRVWLGSEAKEKGLIDGIGGIDEAINKAQELSAIDKQMKIIYYPKPKTIQEKLAELIRGKNNSSANAGVIEILKDYVEELKTLNRMKFDAVLLPIKLSM